MVRLPIRWKLTVWYTLFFTVALVLLGGGLYWGLRERLYEGLDDQIEAQLEIARAGVVMDDGELDLTGVLGLLDDDVFLRLIDNEGSVILERDGEVDDVPALPDAVAAALGGQVSISTVSAGGAGVRVATLPTRVEGAIVGALQLGVPTEDVEETLGDVVALLGIAAPIVLALAVGGGYLLAGRALAPVVAITDLAARIDEHDLHARLDLNLPDDELGRLASTFDGMLARIEEAFARQRRFTGDAAHELRTPLSLMRSQIDLALARTRPADAYREALEGLDTDLERLVRLVATLLTLARADAGQLTLDHAEFDLAETIGLLLDQYGPTADEAGVALESHASPTPIVADEGLLIQVLVNLLDNALAHTSSGGRIAVGCARDGDRVCLWVADTGVGIAPEHRERVFDRFYRVDTGRAREVGGTGLGLAITRAIAEVHGGTIALRDQAGHGTRVELALPAEQ